MLTTLNVTIAQFISHKLKYFGDAHSEYFTVDLPVECLIYLKVDYRLFSELPYTKL